MDNAAGRTNLLGKSKGLGVMESACRIKTAISSDSFNLLLFILFYCLLLELQDLEKVGKMV